MIKTLIVLTERFVILSKDMLDINFIRENPEKVKKACRDKQRDPKIVDELLRVDKKRREILQKIEKLREERNKLTKKDIKRGREIKAKLKALDPKLKEITIEFEELMFQVPSMPASDVPVGKDESENIVVRTWGKIPKLDFKPRDHLEIGEMLDIIDVKRAAKASGTRFGYLKNEAVQLEFALVNFALKTLTQKGFIPVVPPVLIKEEMMRGMGYLEHGGKENMYLLKKDGFVLVGTSEQSIGPMYTGEIFETKDLPRRYVGFSTCFRKEAGTYGKDTRGIFRVHQFDKVEMFSFIEPQKDADKKEHEYLLSLEEELVQALEIPYQITKMCTGDLGDPTARKYDVNCWLPSQKKYRETHSTSTCTDFQARRLNIRYRKNGKTDFVHTLNGTAIAIGRMMIAILENYQQKDGSVLVPKVLQKYTRQLGGQAGFKKISPKR